MTYKGYSARVAYDDNELFTPKTFNNCLGFERGLWQRKSGWFAAVPKTSVCVTGALSVRYARRPALSVGFGPLPKATP
jgi:hypothetical protein